MGVDCTIFENVPIMREQSYHDPRTNELTTITLATLRKVCEVNNPIYDAGDPACIIIGHNAGCLRMNSNIIVEIDQELGIEKPVIGFADKLRCELRAEDGLHYVYARFRIYEDKVGELKRFPRRSAEIRGDNELPTIALLGGSAPALKLGLLLP